MVANKPFMETEAPLFEFLSPHTGLSLWCHLFQINPAPNCKQLQNKLWLAFYKSLRWSLPVCVSGSCQIVELCEDTAEFQPYVCLDVICLPVFWEQYQRAVLCKYAALQIFCFGADLIVPGAEVSSLLLFYPSYNRPGLLCDI